MQALPAPRGFSGLPSVLPSPPVQYRNSCFSLSISKFLLLSLSVSEYLLLPYQFRVFLLLPYRFPNSCFSPIGFRIPASPIVFASYSCFSAGLLSSSYSNQFAASRPAATRESRTQIGALPLVNWSSSNSLQCFSNRFSKIAWRIPRKVVIMYVMLCMVRRMLQVGLFCVIECK